MIIYIYISIIIFFRGLVAFRIKRKHLLLMLLRIEFIVLCLYFNVFTYTIHIGNEFFFSMIFLTFRVCEGALGLAVLVRIIRTHGNDYFQRFNLLW